MQSFNEGQAVTEAFKGKKVAVVVLPGNIEDNHSTQSDVYTYEFSNMSNGLVNALSRKMSGQTKAFKILKPTNLSEVEAGFDYYLFPRLQSRSVNDFWTMGCLITYRLVIKDKEQKVLSDVEDKGKRNFFDSGQANSKCKIAMEEVFEKVTSKALLSVR